MDGDARDVQVGEVWAKATELPRALSYFSALTVQTGRFWKVMSNRH